jgi:methionyl-tRNA formyltransferase
LPLRILFAGTPAFALPALDALAGTTHELVGALTQPDRPAGRGLHPQSSPIKARALALGLPLLQPASLRDEGAQAFLASKAPDLCVVVAYGLLLPPAVLALPRLGCVNVHASLLPRWRGAAPIQRAILAGDSETGISIMHMEAGLDTGPVFLRRATPIGPAESAGDLHDRLAELGARALLEALPGIEDRSRVPEAQDAAMASYAPRIEKKEAWIDWTQPATHIERQVRAFNPWPVCATGYAGQTLRIWEARDAPVADTGVPGTVLAAGRDGIVVATGRGALRLLRVQMPGRRAVDAGDFANAHALAGAVLA